MSTWKLTVGLVGMALKVRVNRRMGASEDFRMEGNTVSAMVYKEVWASKSRMD